MIGVATKESISFSEIQSIGCIYCRDPEGDYYWAVITPLHGKALHLFSIGGTREDYVAVEPLLSIISQETGIPIVPLVMQVPQY